VRAILRPRAVDELQRQVRAASAEGAAIRAVGTGHSWSALVPTDGTLVDTRSLERCLEQGPGWIHVEAGMTLKSLNDHLASFGQRVPGLTIYEHLTVGGVIATGSHGSDLVHGTVADQVLELDVVRPDGEIVRITEADGDTLRAARLGLGALGVTASVKLRCVPARTMLTRDVILPLEEGLERLEELARAHQHLSAYCFPYSRKMWLYAADPTDEPADFAGLAKAGDHAWQYLWFRGLSRFVKAAIAVWPPITYPLARLAERFPVERRRVRSSRDAHHYLCTIPKLVDCEYVVPIRHARLAYRALVDLVEEYRAGGRYPINMALHGRFIKGSDALLSPTRGVDSMTLEAATAPAPDTHAFYREFGARMLGDFDGCPHWGKWFHSAEPLKAKYAGRLERFEAVRRAFDPDGAFLNPLLRSLLPAEAPTGVN